MTKINTEFDKKDEELRNKLDKKFACVSTYCGIGMVFCFTILAFSHLILLVKIIMTIALAFLYQALNFLIKVFLQERWMENEIKETAAGRKKGSLESRIDD